MNGETSAGFPEDHQIPREPVVTSVTRKGSESRQVCLDDGSFFLLSADQCTDLGLREGAEISLSALREAHAEYEASRALEKGISLIASRDHAKRELVRKLEQRGFTESSIDHAIETLGEYGYIDDARFADAYVRERLRRHPEGRMALAAGLSKRGVDRAVIERVLDDVVDAEVEHEALVRAANKLSSDGRNPERLAAALLRRGFAPGQVWAWVRSRKT